MDKTDKSGKILSLLFAILGTALFVGVGISLSYRSTVLALIILIVAFCFVGLGFIIKAKLRR